MQEFIKFLFTEPIIVIDYRDTQTGTYIYYLYLSIEYDNTGNVFTYGTEHINVRTSGGMRSGRSLQRQNTGNDFKAYQTPAYAGKDQHRN